MFGGILSTEDFSGYVVESQNVLHPISVLVGCPCVHMCALGEQNCPGTQMYDSIPPIEGLGDNYVSTPIVEYFPSELSSYHVGQHISVYHLYILYNELDPHFHIPGLSPIKILELEQDL